MSGVEFVMNQYQDNDRSLHYEVEATYPQIARPASLVQTEPDKP